MKLLLEPYFQAGSYDMLRKNCNNFSPWVVLGIRPGIYLITYTLLYTCIYIYNHENVHIPVVPHKAVAEVSKIGNL